MAKTLSPAAIVALKDALSSVYWYKDQLRSFLELCISNKTILSTFNWSKYKIQIVSDIINFFIENPARYESDLTRICYELCKLTDFSHLEFLEEGPQKVKKASNAIKQLKKLIEPHQEITKENGEIIKRQKLAAEKLRNNAATRQKLESIKNRYMTLVGSDDKLNRGFELERIMYAVFELFDLDPKASFKNVGEQIDGAFSLEGTEYLFEAKWQKKLANKADLAVFSNKVTTKLENTLGVFLSVNGFSEDGVTAHQAGGASILLIDGSDLMAVFEERIDFTSLLVRKKRYAAQTGKIYFTYNQMVVGNKS